MHLLVATTGVLDPAPVLDFSGRLTGGGGRVTVATVIEVPRSFLGELRGDEWDPLEDTDNAARTDAEDALVARYVEERGERLTQPLVGALATAGIKVKAVYCEGDDAAQTISLLASEIHADVIVVGATRQIFDESSWESVSSRIMLESGKPLLVLPNLPRGAREDH